MIESVPLLAAVLVLGFVVGSMMAMVAVIYSQHRRR